MVWERLGLQRWNPAYDDGWLKAPYFRWLPALDKGGRATFGSGACVCRSPPHFKIFRREPYGQKSQWWLGAFSGVLTCLSVASLGSTMRASIGGSWQARLHAEWTLETEREARLACHGSVCISIENFFCGGESSGRAPSGITWSHSASRCAASWQ